MNKVNLWTDTEKDSPPETKTELHGSKHKPCSGRTRQACGASGLHLRQSHPYRPSQTLSRLLLSLSPADTWKTFHLRRVKPLSWRPEIWGSLFCSISYNQVYLFKAMPPSSLVIDLPVWDGIISKFNNSKYKARTWRERGFPCSGIVMVVTMSPDIFYGNLWLITRLRGEVGARTPAWLSQGLCRPMTWAVTKLRVSIRGWIMFLKNSYVEVPVPQNMTLFGSQ